MSLIIKSELKGLLVSHFMHDSHYLTTFLSSVEISVTLALGMDYAAAKPTYLGEPFLCFTRNWVLRISVMPLTQVKYE